MAAKRASSKAKTDESTSKTASLGGPEGDDAGTPQDGTVRLPQVDPHGASVEQYRESTESLHPLHEAS